MTFSYTATKALSPPPQKIVFPINHIEGREEGYGLQGHTLSQLAAKLGPAIYWLHQAAKLLSIFGLVWFGSQRRR